MNFKGIKVGVLYSFNDMVADEELLNEHIVNLNEGTLKNLKDLLL